MAMAIESSGFSFDLASVSLWADACVFAISVTGRICSSLSALDHSWTRKKGKIVKLGKGQNGRSQLIINMQVPAKKWALTRLSETDYILD